MQHTRYRSVLSLRKGQTQFAGRNSTGQITVRHRGAGHKQALRTVNWNRSEGKAVVVSFEYDPQRNASLAKIYHKSSVESITSGIQTEISEEPYSYILAPAGRKLLQEIITFNPSQNVPKNQIDSFTGLRVTPAQVAHQAKKALIKGKGYLLQIGDSAPLNFFETGDIVHGVEVFPGEKVRFGRSAGSFCQILALPRQDLSVEEIAANPQFRNGEYSTLRLPSGSHRYVNRASRATRGVVGGGTLIRASLKKAGRRRWLGWRPSVRGVARNPVDHPHGGGQGKTSGGRPSVTFKSWPTKGQPTRKTKRPNVFILSPRKDK